MTVTQAPAPGAARSDAVADSAVQSASLLLVDDEADLLEVIARRLRRRGFTVQTAPGAKEAWDRIASQRFDLVLLDHNMPEMTGMELLAQLRQTHSPVDLPVIMLTAQSDGGHVVKALDLGANDYITKPLDFEVACARIRTQLTRKQAETALRVSEQRYELAGRSTNDGLWDWDLLENRVYYSDRWMAILGLSRTDVGNSPEDWLSRIHEQDRPRLESALEAHWSGAEPSLRFEHRVLHRDGGYRWILCNGLCERRRDGKPTRMAGSITDITEDKVKDPLTGLGNRLHFTELLSRAIASYKQDSSLSFAVLFLDLDRFKFVNDSLGHAAGDNLLRALAQRADSGLRPVGGNRSAASAGQSAVARFGGDEFAILLDGLSSREEAVHIAGRLQKKLSEPYCLSDREVFVTVSVGVAFSHPGVTDADSMLSDADIALYRAKHAGRARVELFDETLRQEVMASLALESDLRRAIAQGEISVHYQPQRSLKDKRLIGFEALARWTSASRGSIPTLEFIALAEKTRLIIPIGEWILRESCRQMREWQRQYPAAADLHISVNLSALQLQQAELVDVVKAALQETGLAPRHLCLEITESTFFADPDAATRTLEELKSLGLRLELDDFGTGYSSLSCLRRLPLDGLKLDRSFTNTVGAGAEDAVVKSILDLANRLALYVVAEGVETESQAEALTELGCEIGQGYHYARPLTPDGVSCYLQRN
jgi:diguanylate cyclase (GGDEF)-like protein/PAS domain S-box-containing protein